MSGLAGPNIDQLLHNPFGFQLCSGEDAGFDESWRISTRDLRWTVPVAVRCIGGPPGTIMWFPTLPTCLPSGVSKQVSPASVYQASGPEWVCEVDPGAGTRDSRS
jgi:hypothetical protein